jgi:hypothetical protein
MRNKNHRPERDHEFGLILQGVTELTTELEDALLEVGCNDATVSLQQGCIYLDFSRRATSFQAAILSAIADVRRAQKGLDVARIDDCNLVSPAEIARRIGRSRQLVHQYITGSRGPGNFPAPECNITGRAPLWNWCTVSRWLCVAQLMPSDQVENAEIVAAINTALDRHHQRKINPRLVAEIERSVCLT